jgi:hypothetical protein
MWVSRKFIKEQEQFRENMEGINTMLIQHIGELMKRVEILESQVLKPALNKPKIPKLEDVIPPTNG